jgi:PAS domain S-box-containing protein
MLGRERDALLDHPWVTNVAPEERAAAAALVARASAAGGVPECRELRCARPDGTTIDTIVSVRGLPGAGGTIDHAMVVVQDITDRKRAEDERTRVKDEFLAAVSHELRTPLTPILAWSTLLRDGRLSDEQARSALATVHRNARAQSLLIDDLLDVSRAVTGEWRLALRPMDVIPAVNAAVEVVRGTAEAKGVTVTASLPDEPLWIAGDAQRVQQIAWNLLSNAVKFTPKGGHVEVSVARTRTAMRLTVRDSGEGISPALLPEVFEPFRQGPQSYAGRQGGLGLGLAIVRALVARHGGTVRAESAGPGKGAVFVAELPLLDPAAVPDDDAPVHPLGGPTAVRLRGLRVLVVDDDPDSNAVVGTLLASCGADVRSATSVAEALEVVGRWQPDVLVSDIRMPGEDGCALVRALRARGGPLAQVPAVALTAYAGDNDRARALAAGFQAHVAKPFDPTQLASLVETAAYSGIGDASS